MNRIIVLSGLGHGAWKTEHGEQKRENGRGRQEQGKLLCLSCRTPEPVTLNFKSGI